MCMQKNSTRKPQPVWQPSLRQMRLVTRSSKEFPALLKQIADPPPKLYVRGNLAALGQPAIAIVGARRATRYGQKQTEDFAESLARAGFAIVSGLAYGVDSWAHLSVIGQGTCVGVIAGGL